jgi:hypothetical protein
MQDGLPAAWIPNMRSLNFTLRASNKNAFPPCGRIFTPVLRFIAPASVMLTPARQKQIKTKAPSFRLPEGG